MGGDTGRAEPLAALDRSIRIPVVYSAGSNVSSRWLDDGLHSPFSTSSPTGSVLEPYLEQKQEGCGLLWW